MSDRAVFFPLQKEIPGRAELEPSAFGSAPRLRGDRLCKREW